MAPTVEFHGQPYDEHATAGAFLNRVLRDSRFDHFTAVVAWARFRGVRRISDDLDALRARGGVARLIVGIDEGIATRPGLVLALRHFSEVFVLHDRPGLTFHPKLYLAEGDTEAALLVGSGNLTAGGLFSNYEASLEVGFALSEEAEEPALSGARAYINRLLGDTEICPRLTEDLVDDLVADPRYGVSSRELRRSRAEGLPDGVEPEDVDPTADEAGSTTGTRSPLFGTSAHRKPAIPPLPPEARDELRELEGAVDTPAPRPSPAGAGAAGRESTPAPPLPPEMAGFDQPVLVAELSKSRNGAAQANFHVVHYVGYFGAQRGTKRQVVLREVQPGGLVAEDEPRTTVEVSSQNYRLELNGLRGHPYPLGDLTPIVVVVQREPGVYLYCVVWPDDPGHAKLTAYLDRAEGVRHGRQKMRQRRAPVDELRDAWPQSPLLRAIATT